MNGCKLVLGVFTYSIINSPIEVKCGDIIWNEVRGIKRRLLCSRCQRLEDEKCSPNHGGTQNA